MFFGLLLVIRPMSILLHELGHAIPALLLTKERVTIYIGSYGDPARSVKFALRGLDIYFRYNPFYWKGGLCVPSADSVSINKQIIYTVTGPITSLIIAAVACYLTFAYDWHGFLKLFLVEFLILAVLDLFVNLYPGSRPIHLYDGTVTYTDGYMLQLLLYYKRFPKNYERAFDLYQQKRYADALELLKTMINNGIKEENVYRLASASYLLNGNYQEVTDILGEFALSYEMNAEDCSHMGFSYGQLGLYEKAVDWYDRSLQLDPNNINSLHNKGYTLNEMNNYEEAIPLFDKVLTLDADFAFAYCNRGLAKIKSGKMAEGLQDIDQGIVLDKDNSYNYRNLGIYHFDKGEYAQALHLFLQAKELDPKTHMIDELIRNARLNISSSGG